MGTHICEFLISAFSMLAKQHRSTLAKSHNGIVWICKKNNKVFLN